MAVKSLAQSSILQPSGVNSLLGDNDSTHFHHLETIRLASPAAAVTFSNLGQYSDYQHLQIRLVGRASRSGATTDPLIVKLNTAAQTHAHVIYGNGSTIGTGPIASQYSLLDAITGANAASNAFGACVVDIIDPFETTKNKTMRALHGANLVVGLSSVFWNSTAAVSSVEFTTFSTTSFLAGSRFSLYGIKVVS